MRKKSKNSEIGLSKSEIEDLIALVKCASRLKPLQKLEILSEAQEMVRRAHGGKRMSEIQKQMEKLARVVEKS